MTTFSLPWANPDLDIHPNPPEGWDRVAVVCGWSDAKKARERWPDAAVVGPLRTLRGLDLFVRGLLANPQIRVVIWDGPDLTPGEVTKSAVINLWDLASAGSVARFDVAVSQHLPTLSMELRARSEADRAAFVTLFDFYQGARLLPAPEWRMAGVVGEQGRYMEGGDRPGGAVILPPPAPTSTDRAPHGDPGDRIVGKTLADLWPRALARVLRCGREAETQHGGTRELLNLVSVIRDPGKTLADFPSWTESGIPEVAAVATAQPHPVLGFSFADVEAYTERLTGAEIPKGAAYSYGSRLRGTGSSIGAVRAIIQDSAVACRNLPGLLPAPAARLAEMANLMETLTTCIKPTPDQIAVQEVLLAHDSRTRAAYLTPWRPEDDAGRESGRPCLTGVWFRAVAGALHMTTTWRSHDTFAGYPLNLAACCLWLTRLADKLGMAVGTLTALSMSAHVYDRDIADAQKVVAAYRPPAGPRWDQRSSWRVELVRTEALDLFRWAGATLKRVQLLSTTKPPGAYLVDVAGHFHPIKQGSSYIVGDDVMVQLPLTAVFSLRATALTSDGTEVLQVFEAKTPERLLRDIGESGLIQETASALWVGREVERVWAGRMS